MKSSTSIEAFGKKPSSAIKKQGKVDVFHSKMCDRKFSAPTCVLFAVILLFNVLNLFVVIISDFGLESQWI